MQYKVLAAYKIRELNEIVNDALSKGWICQGGISIAYTDDSTRPIIYAQAMTKED